MKKTLERYYAQDAANFFKRHPETLRRWDSDNLLTPKRDERGHRFWTMDQMVKFIADHPELFEKEKK